MSYQIKREYKFVTTDLELSRDLPALIELLETLFAKYDLDVREGELPSLDFLNRALNDMNDNVGELMEEYERMIERREDNYGQYSDPRFYEAHYGVA